MRCEDHFFSKEEYGDCIPGSTGWVRIATI